jgi:membrane-bound metal-dependent hydrolase YbcI (DUF457 family)
MPFPLAHPAVVLPLSRIQWLSLSAMMIGCLTPDVSYGLREGSLPRMAHSFAGTFWFCLPVGLIAYLLFRAIREPLAKRLPAPHRQALTPLCQRRPSWFAVAVSIWIGACSHILLDALTHESQMLVPHLAGFRNEIAAIERRGIHFSQLLWFALSAIGVGTLVFAYARLIRLRTGSWSWFDPREKVRYALWLALILIPFLIVAFGIENPVRHWPWRYRLEHFVYHTLALYLVVLAALIILLGLTLRLGQFLAPRLRPSG